MSHTCAMPPPVQRLCTFLQGVHEKFSFDFLIVGDSHVFMAQCVEQVARCQLSIRSSQIRYLNKSFSFVSHLVRLA